MRFSTLAIIALVSGFAGVMSPHIAHAQNLQNEADKGVKTENSGASGFVGEQEKPGAAARPPGEPNHANRAGDVSTAPSAQNSGAHCRLCFTESPRAGARPVKCQRIAG